MTPEIGKSYRDFILNKDFTVAGISDSKIYIRYTSGMEYMTYVTKEEFMNMTAKPIQLTIPKDPQESPLVTASTVGGDLFYLDIKTFSEIVKVDDESEKNVYLIDRNNKILQMKKSDFITKYIPFTINRYWYKKHDVIEKTNLIPRQTMEKNIQEVCESIIKSEINNEKKMRPRSINYIPTLSINRTSGILTFNRIFSEEIIKNYNNVNIAFNESDDGIVSIVLRFLNDKKYHTVTKCSNGVRQSRFRTLLTYNVPRTYIPLHEKFCEFDIQTLTSSVMVGFKYAKKG